MSQSVAIESPAGRGAWRRIFIGPRGLRAGWSLLLFVVVVNAAGAGLFFIITRFWQPPEHAPWTPGVLILGEAVQLAIALAATLLMGRIEGRTLATYGLPLRRAFGGRFWEGAGWGVGSCSLVYVLMAVAGGYRIEGLALGVGDAVRWGVLWALAFLAVALYEESYFRGFPLFTLARGVGFWPAALALSLAFGALHYFQKPNESWLDFANVGLVGLFFCFAVRRTGDVWFATGWHFTFNFVSMGVLGSPNTGNEGGKPLAGHLLASRFHGPAWLTGGPTGAQASIFMLVMVVALFAAFHWRYPQARYPATSAGG